MNRPFASLNLGKVGCFGDFGLSGWILNESTCFWISRWIASCGLLRLSTIAIFDFLALFFSFSTNLLGFSVGFLALFCSFSTKLISSTLTISQDFFLNSFYRIIYSLISLSLFERTSLSHFMETLNMVFY